MPPAAGALLWLAATCCDFAILDVGVGGKEKTEAFNSEASSAKGTKGWLMSEERQLSVIKIN